MALSETLPFMPNSYGNRRKAPLPLLRLPNGKNKTPVF